MGDKSVAGVWVDYRKAFIFSRKDGTTFLEEVESGISSLPEEKALLTFFYDKIIASLEGMDSIVVLGPGKAKGEFLKRLASSPVKRMRIAGIETVDRMSADQVEEYVKEVFGIQ